MAQMLIMVRLAKYANIPPSDLMGWPADKVRLAEIVLEHLGMVEDKAMKDSEAKSRNSSRVADVTKTRRY